jgi:HlyD family secretion protein
MSLTTDAPQGPVKIEDRGKVLRFPAPPNTVKGSWPSLGRYGLAALTAAVLVLAIIAGLWGLSGRNPVPYKTATIARGDIVKTVKAPGAVNPVLTAAVGSYLSGVVRDLYCDDNTPVKAGQVCAKIDPRSYQATLDQYSSQLSRDQAILEKDRTDLGRYPRRSGTSSSLGQQAQDRSYLVARDAATVKLDQALVESAALNLSNTDIASPIDGTVMSRNVIVGQTVAAGSQLPLFLIAADLNHIQVDTSTAESDIGGVAVGEKASFTVLAFPRRAFHGVVTQVRRSPQKVQNVVSYDVIISAENNDLTLIPGMTVSTQIVIDQRSDVLRAPDNALNYTPDGRSGGAAAGAPPAGHKQVWVLRNGAPLAVPVVTGLDDGAYTEILQGDLQPGERVILAENGG